MIFVILEDIYAHELLGYLLNIWRWHNIEHSLYDRSSGILIDRILIGMIFLKIRFRTAPTPYFW